MRNQHSARRAVSEFGDSISIIADLPAHAVPEEEQNNFGQALV